MWFASTSYFSRLDTMA